MPIYKRRGAGWDMEAKSNNASCVFLCILSFGFSRANFLLTLSYKRKWRTGLQFLPFSFLALLLVSIMGQIVRVPISTCTLCTTARTASHCPLCQTSVTEKRIVPTRLMSNTAARMVSGTAIKVMGIISILTTSPLFIGKTIQSSVQGVWGAKKPQWPYLVSHFLLLLHHESMWVVHLLC